MRQENDIVLVHSTVLGSFLIISVVVLASFCGQEFVHNFVSRIKSAYVKLRNLISGTPHRAILYKSAKIVGGARLGTFGTAKIEIKRFPTGRGDIAHFSVGSFFLN